MGYIIGATHLLLCQVLPGNVYVPPTMIKGASLQQGYDSHMSPDKKELVIFNSHHILPFYIVHFTGEDFAYHQVCSFIYSSSVKKNVIYSACMID